MEDAVAPVPDEVMAEIPEATVSLREPDTGDSGYTGDREREATEDVDDADAVLAVAEDREFLIQKAADEDDAFSPCSTNGTEEESDGDVRKTVLERDGNLTEVVAPREVVEGISRTEKLPVKVGSVQKRVAGRAGRSERRSSDEHVMDIPRVRRTSGGTAGDSKGDDDAFRKRLRTSKG